MYEYFITPTVTRSPVQTFKYEDKKNKQINLSAIHNENPFKDYFSTLSPKILI